MNQNLETIEISKMPELLRIAEQVRKTQRPRLLRRNKVGIAILRPVGKRRITKRLGSKKNFEAFRLAAGSWRDVDTDKLIKDIYASRKISSRPPVKL